MIKDTKKLFIFLIFFLATKNVFCAESYPQTSLAQIESQLMIAQSSYQEIQGSLALQAATIYTHTQSIQSFQNEQQVNTNLVKNLTEKTKKQKNKITELTQRMNDLEKTIEHQNQKTAALELTTRGNSAIINDTLQNSIKIGSTTIGSNSSRHSFFSGGFLFRTTMVGLLAYCLCKIKLEGFSVFSEGMSSMKESVGILMNNTTIGNISVSGNSSINVSGNSSINIGSGEGFFLCSLVGIIVSPLLYCVYKIL